MTRVQVVAKLKAVNVKLDRIVEGGGRILLTDLTLLVGFVFPIGLAVGVDFLFVIKNANLLMGSH